MITKKRENELNNYWLYETNTSETREWRKDLSQEEAELVAGLDGRYGAALHTLQGGLGSVRTSPQKPVKILFSESTAFSEGERLTFQEANRKFAEAQESHKLDGLTGHQQVGYEIAFQDKEGELPYVGQFDLGGDAKDFYSHIADETAKRMERTEEKLKMENLSDATGAFLRREQQQTKETRDKALALQYEGKPAAQPGKPAPETEQRAERLGKPAPHEPEPLKGFAYVKSNGQPKVVTGYSKEEILQKLREINAFRKQDEKYSYCNIGSWNRLEEKYGDYHRFDINTGRDVTRIYLELPKADKEEFQQIVLRLKADGAKFHPKLKKWYITQDQAEKFQDYLPGSPKAQAQQPTQNQEAGEAGRHNLFETKEEEQALLEYNHEVAEEIREEMESIKFNYDIDLKIAGFIDIFQNEYLTRLKDGSTLHLTRSEFYERTGIQALNENSIWLETRAILDITKETMNIMGTSREYHLAVSKRPFENQAYIFYKNGPVFDIDGERYGVYLPALSLADLEQIAEEELARLQGVPGRPEPPEPQIGNPVAFFQPVYFVERRSAEQNVSYEIPFICGIKKIFGLLEGIERDGEQLTYVIKDEAGQEERVEVGKTYSRSQAAVLYQAQENRLNRLQFDLIADNRFTPGQMAVLYRSIEDGLGVNSIAYFADYKMPAWCMDVYRYGMLHGLCDQDMKEVFKLYTAAAAGGWKAEGRMEQLDAWESCRKKVDHLAEQNRQRMAADINRHGFNQKAAVLEKMAKLKGMLNLTELELRRINEMYKNNSYPGEPEIHSLVQDLGKDFQKQELQRRKLGLEVPER